MGLIGVGMAAFVSMYILGLKPKMKRHKLGMLWLVLWVFISAIALVAVDAMRYLGAQTRYFSSQADQIRKSVEKGSADFRGEIHSMSMGSLATDPDSPPKSIGVTFSIGILNNGEQSIAWKWECAATFQGGHSITSYASIAKATTTIRSNFKGEQDMVMPHDRYLPHILFESPLADGAGKSGWVTFHFKPHLMGELERPETWFRLSFQDKAGKRTSLFCTNKFLLQQF